MQALVNQILPFLNGNKQFVIPIYQRTYSWTHEQCQQLWDDIVHAATHKEVQKHFIGSIVHIQQGIAMASGISQYLVIDGQQRLTTLNLLLIALARAAKTSTNPTVISSENIYASYLINTFGEHNLRYKLLLTQSDKDTLIHLIDDIEIPDTQKTHLLLPNYKFFTDQIKKSKIDLYTLYAGINKLCIVEIGLDQNDNPQLIFESLNSTGMDLSQSDLIRNYILMGLSNSEQTNLYKKYWYPMGESFGQDTALFSRFIRDYLTIKSESGDIPNMDKVYSTFKTYHQSQENTSIQNIVADIYRYSKYFVKMALVEEQDSDIRKALDDIKTLKVDVAYPFLLEVYDDYEQQHISKEDFIAILRLVESYIFRRAICGVPTQGMNKLFATLMKEIEKDHYLESVQAAFLNKDSYRRFPNDDEFRAGFVVKDVYNFHSRNYLLRKLENAHNKAIVNIDECTIEHILPQNEHLSEEWQQELGSPWQEIQARYLHTIGNLTLTLYNPELSDHTFQQKRDMKDGGFRDSKLRLNKDLVKLDHWNQQDIEKRAARLAEQAVHLWHIPTLSEEMLRIYNRKAKTADDNKTYSLDDYVGLHDHIMRGIFDRLRQRILNLDPVVQEECKKYYIAYKNGTNFAGIEPQKKKLRVHLNLSATEIDASKSFARNMSGKGHHGNGDVEIEVSTYSQIDDAMDLIRQSFEKHVAAEVEEV